MDFTPELSAFQGVIISADNVHTFSRLTARGGNEDQIDYVVENLLKFLEQQRFVVQNAVNKEKEATMRKFAFYIILNAELPSLEQLVENVGIDSVIWTVPTIPRCLMSEMLWKLHMGMFIYEAVAFSCPHLALEVASALVDHLKYSTPSESLPKLRIISSALYKLICRLHFFNYENDVVSNLLASASNLLKKCLDFYIEPPRASLLINMKEDELFKFKGYGLDSMLHLIYECITEFTTIQVFSPANFSEIYQLTYKIGSYKEDALTFATCNTPNKAILECLDKCNEILLDQLKVLVMDVSVTIFCAWSEFDYKGRKMQEVIGELCYKIRTKLLNTNVISEHIVVSMLELISRKPVDVQDIVNMSTSEVIAENIHKNNQNRQEWVKAILQKENLTQDPNLLQIILSNLDVLNENECHQLYNISRKNLTDNIETLKLLAVKSFQKCNLDTKFAILEEHFKEKSFSDMLETSEFNGMLTEIFNKVISDSAADLTDILTVFLQNPQKVYTKIFTLSAESSQQTDIMLKAMALLEKYSNHYYQKDTEPSIIRIAETVLDTYLDKESTQMNFINFFCGLKKAEIIPGTKLLMLIVMPKVHKALLEKDIHRIHFQCKLLSKAFSIDELLCYRAPMLAMLGQIMNVVRWKINTFNSEGPMTLELALQMQKELFSTYGDSIPEKELTWLKSKVYKVSGINSFYFKKLWNADNHNFVESITGYAIQDIDNTLWVTTMAQLLPSAIRSEWVAIWDSFPPESPYFPTLKLELMHKALISLTKAEAMYRENSRSFECVLECHRNFVHIVRYKYFTDPLTDEQVTTVGTCIASSANIIAESSAELLSNIFIPLLAYMVTKKNEYSVNLSELFNETLTNMAFKEKIISVVSSAH